MKARKYTEITVLTEVYVNSQSDYTFYVHIKGYGRVAYDPSVGFYVPESNQDPRMNRFPRYVVFEVDLQVLERLKSPATRYYEYDRDGNKRYENLRYHDAESLALQIEIAKETCDTNLRITQRRSLVDTLDML